VFPSGEDKTGNGFVGSALAYPNKLCKIKRNTKQMKQLILKGLGKAKVKRAVKLFMVSEFNNHLAYNHSQTFTFPLYITIEGFGLPEMDEDDPFTVGELVEFLNNQI